MSECPHDIIIQAEEAAGCANAAINVQFVSEMVNEELGKVRQWFREIEGCIKHL